MKISSIIAVAAIVSSIFATPVQATDSRSNAHFMAMGEMIGARMGLAHLKTICERLELEEDDIEAVKQSLSFDDMSYDDTLRAMFAKNRSKKFAAYEENIAKAVFAAYQQSAEKEYVYFAGVIDSMVNYNGQKLETIYDNIARMYTVSFSMDCSKANDQYAAYADSLTNAAANGMMIEELDRFIDEQNAKH